MDGVDVTSTLLICFSLSYDSIKQFTLFLTVRSSHKTTLLVGTSEVNFVAWVRWQNVGTYPWQFLAPFCDFKASYMPPSGKVTVYSWRGGPKLRFAWSYIKIGQVLRSEMRKMWKKLQMLVSPKLDKISKFQVHIWNQQQILHLRACSHCMIFSDCDCFLLIMS